MFFFFGVSPKTKRYGFVMQRCEAHGGSAWHELMSYRSWFKLFFFLPLFPIGRERHVLTCSECGAAYELSAQEAQQLATQARSDIDVPMSGGLFGGGGLLGQLFGGGGRDYVEDERGHRSGQGQYPAADPYPSAQDDDVYTTEPQQAPPAGTMRIPSRRLDRGA